jgi:uncharacterized protein (TIGR03435 family)
MIPAYLLPLANHLWQSTLFAAATGLLTLAFRKNRAPVRYGLWLAASLKFLIPFSLLVGIGSQLDFRTAPSATPAPLSFVAHQMAQPFTPSIPEPGLPLVPPKPSRVPVVLLGVWLCGFMTSMLPWFNRWRRVRAALRSASPLALDLPIRAMSSSMRLEPGVFGILKPVLLLPDGLIGHLTPAQLDAVLAHELCHVRRRDNLAAAVHMVVEALFWFHPVVWWIETRMMEERERACDEEVLREARDPEVYAEGLLNVCKLYLESPLACMSGVTGANLKKRIEAIMTQRVTLNLTFAKKLLLAAAGMAAVATPILIGILNAPQARGQSQQGPHLAFEVASVKSNKTADPRQVRWQYLPGGGLSATNVPPYVYIAEAYNIPIQSVRLSGGPDWIRSERYDIQATAEKGSIPAGLSRDARIEKSRLMLQTLLADRFHLTMRRETKEIPVYAVVIGKDGPKLQKSAIEEKDCPDAPDLGDATCHGFNGGQGRGLHGKMVNMTDLVEYVSNWTDRPLLDKTGLRGLFAVETEGWQPMRQRPAREAGAEPTAEDLRFADPTTPTLFMIFERLGLKMEPQKAPVEMFVIDHVERPTEN